MELTYLMRDIVDNLIEVHEYFVLLIEHFYRAGGWSGSVEVALASPISVT